MVGDLTKLCLSFSKKISNLFAGCHVGRLKEVLQHGGSILGSVILCGTFRRISQLWDNAHILTWRTVLFIYFLQYHNFLTLSVA